MPDTKEATIVSHTTKTAGGTTFIHNSDYSGTVHVLVHTEPQRQAGPAGPADCWAVTIPFADLRQLVFAYLRDQMISTLEQVSDETLEQMLTNGSGIAW